jgi:hypothetical protein
MPLRQRRFPFNHMQTAKHVRGRRLHRRYLLYFCAAHAILDFDQFVCGRASSNTCLSHWAERKFCSPIAKQRKISPPENFDLHHVLSRIGYI